MPPRGGLWARCSGLCQRYYPAAVVGLVAVMATLWAWQYVRTTAAAREAARFDAVVHQTQGTIEQRLARCVDALRGAQGLVISHQQPSRVAWGAYVDSIGRAERHPGLEELGYVERIYPDSSVVQLARFRAQGLPFLTLRPAGFRDQYFPILLLEPVDAGRTQLFGFDLLTEPVRRAAMLRAGDTGQPAASSRVAPLIEGEDDASARVALFVPFYRENAPRSTVEQRRAALVGFVYGTLRVEEVLRDVFDAATARTIDFEVFDGERAAPELRLLDAARGPSDGDGRLSRTTAIDVGGRRWTLSFRALPAFDLESRTELPLLVLGGGLVIGGLLVAITLGQIRSSHKLVRSVEQQRELEDQLRQAQKMEALGRMAGGIAHDFNNLLSVILGFAELGRERTQVEEHRRYFEQIEKAGTRGAAVTKQLLVFARKQVLEPQIVDVNSLMTGLQPMLRRLVREDVEMVLGLDPTLGRVQVDPVELERAVMNLVANARDAMPSGGRLTIETNNVELGPGYMARHTDVRPGTYVMVAVSDTGVGMDAQTVARIFEPFFTTKERGKGTGLGLPTVYSIVQQSGGHIWVYSEPGHGTTVKLYLPLVSAEIEAPTDDSSNEGDLSGSETILVVEDEDMVRTFVCDVLASRGYQILAATNGADGLQTANRHDGPIHLLLTDVIMPKMNGRMLADQVGPSRPDTRFLFMSGYTDDVILHHGVLDEESAFLQKPFKPEALLRKVRQVLDRPKRAAPLEKVGRDVHL